jgi:peptidoglycan/LPS O-acetylase OafA/YrhL
MVILPVFIAGIVGLFWHNNATLPETLRTIYFPRRLEIIFEPFLAAMAFASVIAVITRRPAARQRRLLESRALATVSRYSYGMYMLNVVVILMVAYYGVPLRNPALGMDLPWQLAFAAIVVTGCLIAGFLSWHLWEKWFLKAAPAYTYARGEKGAEAQPAHASSEALPLPAP